MLALHEPFCNLEDHGETDVDGRVFVAPEELLRWFHARSATHDISVFSKDTTDRRHPSVLADRRFLAEARHAFLIRRPAEIAASWYALESDIRVEHIGLEALFELHSAVRRAGGYPPVVIDSDDLVERPAATMAAYCAAVDLPFREEALRWDPGDRSEWRRTARWHEDVAATSGFERRARTYSCTVENTEALARLANHHLPFYEELHAQRLSVRT